jgi:carbonic anhydrase
MMFKLKLTFSIIISLIIYSTCFAAKNKVKQSLMEYMNDFFTQDNTEFQFNSRAFRPKNELDNQKYRFSQQNATAPPAAGAPPGATNGTSQNSSGSSGPVAPTYAQLQTMVMQDWLMISSPMFQDAKLFPPVLLPDGRRVAIRVDKDKFRLNDAFTSKTGSKPPSLREFWFRLSGLNLYYTASKEDINILGAIAIQEIKWANNKQNNFAVIGNNITSCFNIKDSNDFKYKMCTSDKSKTLTWYCAIQTLLGNDLNECNVWGPNQNTTTVTIEKTITQPIIVMPTPSKFCNEDWNYQKMGADWECDCAEGKEQSPIDLPTKENAIDSPVKPFFQYDKILMKSPVNTIEGYLTKNANIKLEYVDNALRLIYHKIGKVVTLDGAIYYAQEIIFHTPAEHTINGKNFNMEVQVIHHGQTKGDIAKQISLSFLIEKHPGVYNQFIDDFDFFDLPNPNDPKKNLKKEVYLPKIFFDLKDTNNPMAFWKPFSFYTYQGSLSFPPCTENTIVYVAAKPIRLGSTAITLFQEALRVPDMMNPSTGDIIVSNWINISARKVQPTNGRPVYYYDHIKSCGPDPPEPKPYDEGHYEKVKTIMTKYFYVDKNKPSGVPQSFVVPKAEADGDDPSAIEKNK